MACLAMHCATAPKRWWTIRRVAVCKRETMKGRAGQRINEAGPTAELPRYERYLPTYLPALQNHLMRAQFAILRTTTIDNALRMWANRQGSNAIPTGRPYSPKVRARRRSGRIKEAQDCHQCTVQPCRKSTTDRTIFRPQRTRHDGRKLLEGDANNTNTPYRMRAERHRSPRPGRAP